jgi:hypothetical protein
MGRPGGRNGSGGRCRWAQPGLRSEPGFPLAKARPFGSCSGQALSKVEWDAKSAKKMKPETLLHLGALCVLARDISLCPSVPCIVSRGLSGNAFQLLRVSNADFRHSIYLSALESRADCRCWSRAMLRTLGLESIMLRSRWHFAPRRSWGSNAEPCVGSPETDSEGGKGWYVLSSA